MAFTLIDGVARNAENPDTFAIPSLEERKSVQAGDYVKLGFECEDEELGGERMWVEVTTTGEKLTGTVGNDPIVIPELKFGDEVRFEHRHIIGLY